MSGVIYASGQLNNIADLIDTEVEWFILGGPADADEAQTMNTLRPDIKIVGFEPNPTMLNIQQERQFPGTLLPFALWNRSCELDLVSPSNKNLRQSGRCSSLVRQYTDYQDKFKVTARTLDSLSVEYGPFQNSVLWIDIEGSEIACLEGAANLLDAEDIRLINAEVFSEQDEEMSRFLLRYGIKEVHRWGEQSKDGRFWCNVVYKAE